MLDRGERKRGHKYWFFYFVTALSLFLCFFLFCNDLGTGEGETTVHGYKLQAMVHRI